MLTGPLAGALSTLSALVVAPEPATIHIRCDQTGPRVSPSLWGLFFEEINHAGDGGLYAELIRNRSFEETLPVEGCELVNNRCVAPELPNYSDGRPRRWSVGWQFESPWPGWSLAAPDGAAALSLESADPVHPRSARYLRLSVKEQPPEGVRLLNEGYWGVAVTRGEVYDVSLFARARDGFSGRVRVGVVAADGRVLCEAVLANFAADWRRHACSLVARGTARDARFFVQPLGTGALDLDVISLFPRRTFHGRPNGVRADLGQMLADLRPAFLRFPGGCVVEGATMANRYRWKETIGPVETRPGHWSLWGYRNTDGLGYHEFLQLCEDLRCDALYVANCGFSCTYRNGDFWPDERIDELIGDTLDAVEYALGPPTSTWGAVRAAAGHPEPFPLRYLEVGNENFGPRYEALYQRFAAAISKAWPQLELISDVKIPGAPIEDQHFYVAPTWFFENFNRYDQVPREGAPRVYVGEYACNQEVGHGNLLAALSEAVFMMGLERNSDLVTMASYAPLFFHVNNLAWPVNLIGFDNASSFGRTSYWVQQMFAAHRPDVLLASTVASPTEPLPARAGRVGVGTWDTQAEFRDLRVTRGDQVLYASDFAAGTSGWKLGPGQWSVVDGALRQASADRPATALVGDPSWSEYTYELRARKLSGSEGFLIPFQSTGQGKSWWNLGGWGNREHGIEAPGFTAPRVPGSIETGRWYQIRIEVGRLRVRCLLDGELIHEAARRELPRVYASAGRDEARGEVVVKAINRSSEPQPVTLRLPGAKLAATGQAVVLAWPDVTAENSLAEPRKIVPVTHELTGVGTTFDYLLPAHALVVLRLRER